MRLPQWFRSRPTVPTTPEPPLRVAQIEDLRNQVNDLMIVLQSFDTRLALYTSTHDTEEDPRA